MTFRFSRAVALAPFLLVAAVGARAETVSIDQQVFKADKATVTVKGLSAVESSLSKDDLVKMLSPGTPDAERAALIKTFKAARLTIPSVEVTDKKGALTVRDIAAERIDGGRVGKLTVAGAESAGSEDMKLKVNALTLEDGDFSSVAAALLAGDPMQLGGRVGSMKFDGFNATIREDGPKDKTGTVDISMAGAESRAVMDGDVPKSATFSVKNVVVAPQKGSKLGRDLTAFGYDKLDLGMKGDVSYDVATKAFALTDFTINGANAGALTLSAALGNVDKGFYAADSNQRLASFIGANLSEVKLKFVNAGLFDRALAFVAGAKSKETVRSDWAKAAGQYIPIMLGGDASALALASEVQKFINAPKSLLLTAKAKGAPVSIIELPGLKDPVALLKRVDLSASANQ